MNQEPIGVIDVGTNTFHLLIAQPLEGGGFAELFRERRFIKLAQDGIHYIGQAPYQRALDTMRDYRQIMDDYGVQTARAFGTAALRTAGNGAALQQEVHQKTGIFIELIDGNQEALYILRGVRLALPFDETPALVMDIGGGSVEFLIANDQKIFWMQSFPIGVAVLYRNFHRHEPMDEKEMVALQNFLEEQLQPLKEALEHFPTTRLIGVSGTFDVLEHMLEGTAPTPTYASFSLNRFPEILDQVVRAPIEERLQMSSIPRYRADMIVVALLLIKAVLHLSPFQDILVSHYDLKEGILDEILRNGTSVPPPSSS